MSLPGSLREKGIAEKKGEGVPFRLSSEEVRFSLSSEGVRFSLSLLLRFILLLYITDRKE